MKLTEYLLFGIIGWFALGALGAATSLRRGRRKEARRQLAWLAAVLGGYLIALLLVSVLQPRKTVALGQDQCYGKMCFAVTDVDDLPGLIAGDPDSVLRVHIKVVNRGEEANTDSKVRALVIDSQGRTWQSLPGLSGNRLTATVAGKSEMVSEPMFRIAQDSTGLKLVFTHGKWHLNRLAIGDTDSFGHRPTVVDLDR